MSNSTPAARRRPLWLAACACLLLAHGPAQAGKAKVAYVPGITLTPDVLLAADQTPRTYNTPQGATLWHEGLPVQQGDRMKLNVFVATGGADLGEIKVRLDNALIADVKAAPWNTLIDTAPLATGYHMIEVWAQATGSPPQSSTRQLTFYVVKDLPAQYAVKGSIQQQLAGEPAPAAPAVSDEAPPLPAALAGRPLDVGAAVTLGYKAASLPASAPDNLPGADAITLGGPTVFSVGRAPGGTATGFTYALVRSGTTILTSASPISLVSPTRRTLIKIQKRTDAEAGLRPGLVTLWVWGVDAQGDPGSPSRALLQIP